MKTVYKTKGVCAREIIVDVEDGIVKEVEFIGGCAGNTKGVAILAKNRPIEELVEILSGVDCNSRGTSCPDQLALALKKML